MLLRPGGELLLAEAGHELTPATATLPGFRAVAESSGLRWNGVEELGDGQTLLVRASPAPQPFAKSAAKIV